MVLRPCSVILNPKGLDPPLAVCGAIIKPFLLYSLPIPSVEKNSPLSPTLDKELNDPLAKLLMKLRVAGLPELLFAIIERSTVLVTPLPFRMVNFPVEFTPQILTFPVVCMFCPMASACSVGGDILYQAPFAPWLFFSQTEPLK